MKKLTAFILTIILLLSTVIPCALSEGRDFLTFVSTYYWALGQRLDDIPYNFAHFLCNLPEDENYAVYSIQGGQITLDSRTGEIIEFDAPSPGISSDEVLMSSLVFSLEYDFAPLDISLTQKKNLEIKWNSVSDILNKVYTDGSCESERYIYEISSSERFHVIEKDYAAAQQ